MIWGSDANQPVGGAGEGELRGGGLLLIAFSDLFISCPAALNSRLEGRRRVELVSAGTHANSGGPL